MDGSLTELPASDFGRNDCLGDCVADLMPDGDVEGGDLSLVVTLFDRVVRELFFKFVG